MRPSFFNFYKADSGLVLVYNSASGNCIVIDEAELSSFMAASLNKGDIEKLSSLGFMVEDDVDETERLIRNAYSNLNRSKRDKYRVLTTTACNARCPYCYEKGVKPFNMTTQTADKLVTFILEKSKHKRTVEIEWFGGEPLLNKEIIAYISKRIDEQKPADMAYEASIITNGYLLDSDTIQKMVNEWSVKRIQVTLDGTAKAYERIKGLGDGAFCKVLDNIRQLSEYDLKIDVRLNFDENNLNDMTQLIKYLSTLDFKNRLSVYPAKINDGLRRENFALEKESIVMYNTLHDCGLLRGLDLLPKTMKSPCAASKKSYYTVHATGELFKCDRKLLKGNCIGSVYTALSEPLKDTEEWELIQPNDKCRRCKMFPLCWGGCIYERLNHLDRCYITEKIIDNNLGLILSDYINGNNK